MKSTHERIDEPSRYIERDFKTHTGQKLRIILAMNEHSNANRSQLGSPVSPPIRDIPSWMLTCDARVEKRDRFVEVKRFHARADRSTRHIDRLQTFLEGMQA